MIKEVFVSRLFGLRTFLTSSFTISSKIILDFVFSHSKHKNNNSIIARKIILLGASL